LYLEFQEQLTKHLSFILKQLYGSDLPRLEITQPPEIRHGEYAIPLFELAKKLRKSPRQIAEEIVTALGTIHGFEVFEIAGGGYINAKLD